jgi:hypothetical protein
MSSLLYSAKNNLSHEARAVTCELKFYDGIKHGLSVYQVFIYASYILQLLRQVGVVMSSFRVKQIILSLKGQKYCHLLPSFFKKSLCSTIITKSS